MAVSACNMGFDVVVDMMRTLGGRVESQKRGQEDGEKEERRERFKSCELFVSSLTERLDMMVLDYGA